MIRAPFIVVNITEARARFSELVRRAEAGETFGITKRGMLVALLEPLPGPKAE